MKLKIQGKLLVYILSTAFVIYAVAFGYLVKVMFDDAKISAVKLTDETAARYAEVTQNELNKDFEVTRTFLQIVKNYHSYSPEERERNFDPILKEILMANPNFIAVWYTWERKFIEEGYSQNYGRVRVAFYNQKGKTGKKLDTLDRQGDVLESTYYGIKINPREILTDPYKDSYTKLAEDSTVMATAAIPIFYQGEFGGLVGVDVALDRFQRITDKIQPFQNAKSFMISYNGNCVASQDKEMINNSISSFFGDENEINLLTKIKNGEKFSYFADYKSKYSYLSFFPLKLGNSEKPWSIGIVVPVSEIMNKVRVSTIITIIVAFLGLIAMTVVIWYFSKKITIPLVKTTEVIKSMTEGDISQKIEQLSFSDDEIGDIRRSLDSLIKNLNITAEFAIEIGKGNLESEYIPLSEKDVLGNSLLEMRKSLKFAAEEEKKRREEDRKLNWATTGTAQFAEILRTNPDNLENFSYSIIRNIVKYLDVNQGGIFIINDTDKNNKFIELVAGFAYDRQKMLRKKIPMGVGLVGRCIKERETIYMTQIPTEYINITSGLGENNPTQLLIVPLIFNNEIFGAVELASFSEIVNYKIKFIEKIGESIASTLATVKINITTARLLEETKLKSEEMASQEEEIRQNMEEMISSQEELNAKSNGLTEIIDAIQSVIYFVEYNMQGKITDINEKYLEILHKRKEDIVGKFQGSFGLELQNIQFFNDFWDQLRAGKVRYYDQDLLIENKIVTISSTYIPILDQDRIPHKVISIASIK